MGAVILARHGRSPTFLSAGQDQVAELVHAAGPAGRDEGVGVHLLDDGGASELGAGGQAVAVVDGRGDEALGAGEVDVAGGDGDRPPGPPILGGEGGVGGYPQTPTRGAPLDPRGRRGDTPGGGASLGR